MQFQIPNIQDLRKAKDLKISSQLSIANSVSSFTYVVPILFAMLVFGFRTVYPSVLFCVYPIFSFFWLVICTSQFNVLPISTSGFNFATIFLLWYYFCWLEMLKPLRFHNGNLGWIKLCCINIKLNIFIDKVFYIAYSLVGSLTLSLYYVYFSYGILAACF